jgi:hypothetical protein
MPTSLATKLGIKADSRSILIGAPKEVSEALASSHANFAKALTGEFEYMHVLVPGQKSLHSRFPKLKSHLSRTGSLWVSWPKGGANDTDLSLRKVIEIGYKHGLVESKTIGVDSTWSAIKFTFPKKGKRYNNSYGKLPENP